MNRFFALISRLGYVLAGAAMILMLVHVTLDSLLRSFTKAPTLGTIEIVSFYYMVTVVFAGLFIAAEQKQHLAVDVAYVHLPEKLRKLCRFLVWVISIGYLGAFAYALMIEAIDKTAINEQADAIVMRLSIWPARWLAAISLAATAGLFFWRFLHDISKSLPDDTEAAPAGSLSDSAQQDHNT